ncbi:MAG TPA: hypothetical protein VIY54_06760 [Steroidobacteraceae bacterium]
MLPLSQTDHASVAALLQRYGLVLQWVAPGQLIPGTYWGDSEAGLLGHCVYARADTPLHSVLHECCHFVCMHAARRAHLAGDAGGDDLEECAVCYLQVLLADELPGVGREQMFCDMDEWGYSFRLGRARAWFCEDAQDARHWLSGHGVIDAADRPTGALR